MTRSLAAVMAGRIRPECVRPFVASAAFLFLLTVAGCAVQPRDDEVMNGRMNDWVRLFDGRSMEGWNRIGESNWHVEDGALVADRGNKAPSYLVSRDSYGDFELKVEFWFDPAANSGVFLRCSEPRKVGAATAYEVQISDPRTDGYGTGAITDLAKVTPPLHAAGQWNTYLITAKGPNLSVRLNGALTAETQNGKYAHGPIGLQHIAGVVKFRRVEIRPL